MMGNVGEWCQDWYDSDKTKRVLRGGAWNLSADYLRVALPNYNVPSSLYYNLGFRCVSGFPAAKQ